MLSTVPNSVSASDFSKEMVTVCLKALDIEASWVSPDCAQDPGRRKTQRVVTLS